MLTAIIRERYQKNKIKKNPTVSKNMDIFTGILVGAGWGRARWKKKKTQNDGTENKRADNVKSLFNKHSWDAAEGEETWKLPFYSQSKSAHGRSEIEYLVNEWAFSCQEIGMIIYFQQLVGLNIKEKLQESRTARRGCLLVCMGSTLTVKRRHVQIFAAINELKRVAIKNILMHLDIIVHA